MSSPCSQRNAVRRTPGRPSRSTAAGHRAGAHMVRICVLSGPAVILSATGLLGRKLMPDRQGQIFRRLTFFWRWRADLAAVAKTPDAIRLPEYSRTNQSRCSPARATDQAKRKGPEPCFRPLSGRDAACRKPNSKGISSKKKPLVFFPFSLSHPPPKQPTNL